MRINTVQRISFKDDTMIGGSPYLSPYEKKLNSLSEQYSKEYNCIQEMYSRNEISLFEFSQSLRALDRWIIQARKKAAKECSNHTSWWKRIFKA